jgi:hypothetical protein
MSTCIICREEKKEFSDEHVIPDAIGGCYHIYSVCKDCNSVMGNKVDNKLVDHMFSTYLRFLKKIKGKSGHFPNPFTGTHHLENDISRKFQLYNDKESKFELYALPKVTDEKINENIYRISISVDDKDINKIDDILYKRMERLGLNINQIVSKETIKTSKKGLILSIHNRIDTHDYKIGLLKIAYEFAVSVIQNYSQDEMAIEISHVLINAIYDKVTNYVNVGDGFTKKLLFPLSEYLDFEGNKHYLILLNYNGKLYCLLSIFNMFIVGVQLSNKSYLSELDVIVGINNYAEKTFTIHTLFDIINKMTHYSYTYVLQFSSESDENEFIEDTKETTFPFHSNQNGILLFDSTGVIILNDLSSILINYFSNKQTEHGRVNIEIPIPYGHFVKTKKNNRIIKLISVIEKRTNSKI